MPDKRLSWDDPRRFFRQYEHNGGRFVASPSTCLPNQGDWFIGSDGKQIGREGLEMTSELHAPTAPRIHAAGARVRQLNDLSFQTFVPAAKSRAGFVQTGTDWIG